MAEASGNLDDETFGADINADANDDFDIVGSTKAAAGLMKEAQLRYRDSGDGKANKVDSKEEDGMRIMSSVLNILDDDDDDDDDDGDEAARNARALKRPQAPSNSAWGRGTGGGGSGFQGGFGGGGLFEPFGPGPFGSPRLRGRQPVAGSRGLIGIGSPPPGNSGTSATKAGDFEKQFAAKMNFGGATVGPSEARNSDVNHQLAGQALPMRGLPGPDPAGPFGSGSSFGPPQARPEHRDGGKPSHPPHQPPPNAWGMPPSMNMQMGPAGGPIQGPGGHPFFPVGNGLPPMGGGFPPGARDPAPPGAHPQFQPPPSGFPSPGPGPGPGGHRAQTPGGRPHLRASQQNQRGGGGPPQLVQQQQQSTGPPRIHIPLPRKRFRMMSKQEIAHVIKWQLTQLRSSNPMDDDFYYQIFQSRRGLATASVTLLDKFKWHNNPTRNPDGTPKLDPSTLGKIRASNLRAPKKLMDLSMAGEEKTEEDGGSTPTEAGADAEKEGKEAPPARRNLFRKLWTTVSYLVEQGMQCLISIEDVNSVIMALQNDPQSFASPGRQLELEQWQAKLANEIKELCEALDMEQSPNPSRDHVVLKFSHLRKGRLLLDRSLLRLPPVKAGQLAAIMLFDAKQFAKHSTDVDESLATNLCNIVLPQMPIQRLNHVFHTLATQAKQEKEKRDWKRAVEFIGSSLVCKCLQAILKKGHETDTQIRHMLGEAQAAGMGPPPHAEHFKNAMKIWRQILNFFFALLKGQLKSGLFESYAKDGAENEAKGEADVKKGDKKKGEEKEKKDNDVASKGAKADDRIYFASPLRELWELVASMVSHGTQEQRDMFKEEIVELLKIEQLNPNNEVSTTAPDTTDGRMPPVQPCRGYDYLSNLFRAHVAPDSISIPAGAVSAPVAP